MTRAKAGGTRDGTKAGCLRRRRSSCGRCGCCWWPASCSPGNSRSHTKPIAGPTETVIATDSFNRANGSLGPNWTATSDGAMSIVSQQVAGVAGADSGEIRTGESYPSDQFSQLTVSATALSGGRLGRRRRCGCRPAGRACMRACISGTTGSPELMLFLRNGGELEAAGFVQQRGAGGRDAVAGDGGGEHDLAAGRTGWRGSRSTDSAR